MTSAMERVQDWVQTSMTQGMLILGAGAGALLGVTGYILAHSKAAILEAEGISLDNQSLQLKDGTRTSYHTPANGEAHTYCYPDARTTHEAFKRGLKVSNNGRCLGTRTGGKGPFQWLHYRQIYGSAQQLGSALLLKGLQASPDTNIGVYAANCPEWVVTEQACSMYSMVVVPLYDTLGTEACTYIINKTDMSLVVCDKVAKAQALISAVDETPSIRHIVLVEEPNQELQDSAQKAGISLYSMAELLELGLNNLAEPVPPKPSDPATICFTSGTTGNPKGVVLTHENLLANVASVYFSFDNQVEITQYDIHISYLPLAHMFERLVQLIMFIHGGQIGIFSGSVRTLMDDIKILKPTIFCSVPRLLNRVYDKVKQGVSGSWIKSTLYDLALSRKLALLRSGVLTKDTIWDQLIFRRIQDSLGGHVKLIISGSAPLSNNVIDFLRCSFGCMVIEAYGQTECTAGATLTLPHDTTPGSVGPPMSGMRVKLIDVPDMSYFAKDNKGEVCLKGPSIMQCYYRDEEKTKEAFDEDGWLLTGDIGMWLPNGTLRLIDRRKHLFKLAQGEYLAPEKIELVYLESKYVAQVFIEGNSLETFPVGVVVPDKDVLLPWATSNNLKPDLEQLCNNPTVNEMILEDITRIGKAEGLKGFEQARKIYLQAEPFSLENGLLTPTFKSKRPVMRAYFKEQVVEMYNKANAAAW